MNFDYIIVGAGLTGCVMAEQLSRKGSVLIIEKRDHIAGNCYDYYNSHHILVHKYGPHFFHTNDPLAWEYLSRFTKWRHCSYKVLSYVDGCFHPFPLPPSKINETTHRKFYESYSRKQWGKFYDELDKSVIDRVKKTRDEDDQRYHTDRYQGIPVAGYTRLAEELTSHNNIHILLKTDYLTSRGFFQPNKALIYTGKIDDYFPHLDPLPYISLQFEHETFNVPYKLPAPQINFPIDYDFTRMVEIKHVTGQVCENTTIVTEYPRMGNEPFYPIPCEETGELYDKYNELAKKEKNVYFIGRLAEYRYLDMDRTVINALYNAQKILKI